MTNHLEDQIVAARLEISADSISMSVSELTSLYREGTLQIRPEFQRLFRWDAEQKSRLVESILLGIPLPSLFVAQSPATGKWELVDGLQRVSTLLELQGLLAEPDGSVRPSLILTSTKFLPALEGHSWDGSSTTPALTDAQKLDIRLARLDIKVIKRSSDPKAKFDLFERLNSYGSALTPQEIRSAMIAGTDIEALEWIGSLARSEAFQRCVTLSDRLIEEQYDTELVLRFLMLHNRVVDRASSLSDFAGRLNDWAVTMAANYPASREQLEPVFRHTFDSIAENADEDVFRKWDSNAGRFRGAFLNTSYEVIALGVAFHVAKGAPHRTDYTDAARELWSLPDMTARFATGLATQDRLAKTIPLGRKLMASPPEVISADDL